MRASRAITVVGCHAGGEIGNVVVGGVAPPPGDDRLRADAGAARGRLAPPAAPPRAARERRRPREPDRAADAPDCDAGYVIMEPTEYPAMSGSNTICVATVLLETGMVEMREPVTTLRLEAPARPRRDHRGAAADGRSSASS